MHFLLACPRYITLRHKLVESFRFYCFQHNKPVPENRKVLFYLLMTCQDKCIINALATYLWEAFNKRSLLLGLLQYRIYGCELQYRISYRVWACCCQKDYTCIHVIHEPGCTCIHEQTNSKLISDF